MHLKLKTKNSFHHDSKSISSSNEDTEEQSDFNSNNKDRVQDKADMLDKEIVMGMVAATGGAESNLSNSNETVGVLAMVDEQ